MSKTVHIKNVFGEGFALDLYERLRDEIDWEDGIKFKTHGITRIEHRVDIISELDYEVRMWVENAMKLIQPAENTYYIIGVYLIYYADGKMWSPNHTLPGQHQIMIPLGTRRT